MINSILEVDYYKKTMQQFVWKNFPNEVVKYAFKNRTKNVKLGFLKDELREQFSRIQKLQLTDAEIFFMKMQFIFSDDYLNYAKNVNLPDINVDSDKEGNLIIETEANWADAIDWELLVLSTVNELYYTKDNETLKNDWNIGEEHLLKKIELIKKHPDFKFIDFGNRRAYSTEWHKRVLEILLNEIPNQLVGTSNIHLAKHFAIKPVGTFAHECTMCGANLFGNSDDEIRNSQNKVFDLWYDMYGESLSICLTDTYGSDYTFSTFGKERAKKWKGLRQDSGIPSEFVEKQIKMYQNFGINSTEKWFIPSDGLTVESAIELFEKYKKQICVLPAIGTSLTNDLGKSPLSIVMKAVKVNNVGTVKLSDNIAKATGDLEDVEKFKRIFGYENTSSQETTY